MSNFSKLIKDKRFLPLFLSQFTSAFNDNIFKNALIILLTYNTAILPSWVGITLAVNITAALLILPFFLFSSIAGQYADYKEKSSLIFKLKCTELILMIAGMIGLASNNLFLMWGVIFGLGTQAAFFGPLKYSIIPQLVNDSELTAGNALIESGTFLSILLGTILGGILIELDYGYIYLTVISVMSGLVGLVSSWYIPKAPSSVLNGTVDFNIVRQTKAIINIARKNDPVFKSILAISWFWFLGAVLITEFPILIKEHIGGSPSLVTIFLSLFSIGVIVGALVSEKLSFGKVEIGLVPLGAIGIIVALTHFTISISDFNHLTDQSLLSFVKSSNGLIILLDLFVLSIFGGLFTVPLYAFLQEATDPSYRSRVISANNIINSLFMVVASIFIVVVTKVSDQIEDVFWCLIAMHMAITIYIFSVVPEFLIKLLLWLSLYPIYKFESTGLDKIPEDNASLLICKSNEIKIPFLLFAAINFPVKFGVDQQLFNMIPKFFSVIGAFPVHFDDRFDTTIDCANRFLNDGETVLLVLPDHFIHNSSKMKSLETITQSFTYPVLNINISYVKNFLFRKTYTITVS